MHASTRCTGAKLHGKQIAWHLCSAVVVWYGAYEKGYSFTIQRMQVLITSIYHNSMILAHSHQWLFLALVITISVLWPCFNPGVQQQHPLCRGGVQGSECKADRPQHSAAVQRGSSQGGVTFLFHSSIFALDIKLCCLSLQCSLFHPVPQLVT